NHYQHDPGDRTRVDFHVHGACCAVRKPGPSLHYSAYAAALDPLRAALADRHRTVAEFVQRAGCTAAVGHREEERDFADRLYEPAALAGLETPRRDHGSQPRAA